MGISYGVMYGPCVFYWVNSFLAFFGDGFPLGLEARAVGEAEPLIGIYIIGRTTPEFSGKTAHIAE